MGIDSLLLLCGFSNLGWWQASFPSSSLLPLPPSAPLLSSIFAHRSWWLLIKMWLWDSTMSRYFPMGTHWLTYLFFLVSSRSQDPKPSSQRNCLVYLRRFLEYHTSSFVSDFSPCWNKIPDESRLRKQGKVYIQSRKEGTFGQGGKRMRQPVALCPQSGSRETILPCLQSRTPDHGMMEPHLVWAIPPQLALPRNTLPPGISSHLSPRCL